MKSFSLFVLITFLASSIFAQDHDQEYMDDIVIKSCECIDKLPEDLNMEMRNVELGMCIINAASKYESELKRDHNIDFKKIDTQGEELGMLIGAKMAGVCPQKLMSLVSEENSTSNSVNEFKGKLISIKGEPFSELSIKDENGKTLKFYWLTYVKSESDLANFKNQFIYKNVIVEYSEGEFFDSRLNEYRTFNVLESLNFQNPED